MAKFKKGDRVNVNTSGVFGMKGTSYIGRITAVHKTMPYGIQRYSVKNESDSLVFYRNESELEKITETQ